MATTIKHVQTVKASPAAVNRAFTNAGGLREWLADIASVDPRVGGRLFLAWNSGYYSAGEFVKVIPEKEIQFIWSGRDDPAPSRVRVSIQTFENNLTSFTLEHFDLNDQGEWAAAFQNIERGWALGMQNLVSILENGPDLRIVNRPMMGVFFGEFDQRHLKELGVPVSEGMRVDNVVEDMGAQRAGLKRNDVIVAIDGKSISDFASVVAIMQNKQAGERVDVSYYRGSEKKKASMELSRRQIPEMPLTPAALSAQVARTYSIEFANLTKALEGVEPERALRRPAPEEWNALEAVAHLIHSERDTHLWINELVLSQERNEGSLNNLNIRVQATVKAYGSLDALVLELERSQAETIALLASLPPEFVANKGSFWRLCYQLSEVGTHIREHIDQILACTR